MENYLNRLSIGISGAIPEKEEWGGNDILDYEILEFLQTFSGLVMKYGGTIVHGSHPTFTPILIKQAQKFRSKKNSKPLILIMSELFYKDYNDYEKKYFKENSGFILCKQIGEGNFTNEKVRNDSLTLMREKLISEMDIFIAIGGKNHKKNTLNPGVEEEFNLAIKKKIPIILLPIFKGMTEELSKSSNIIYNIDNIIEKELNDIRDVYSYSGLLFNKLIEYNKRNMNG